MNLVQQNIEYNRKTHDLIAEVYNQSHPEIYNSVEQERIQQVVLELISKIGTMEKIKVLDFGSGTGNLSLKFLEQNCEVTSCDISQKSLNLIGKIAKNKENLNTVILTGKDLPFSSNTFDIVATYSVLHHVPDYLNAVNEMIRVCKPNGLVYIDHERNDHFWFPGEKLKEWQKLTTETVFEQFKRVLSTKVLFTPNFIKSIFIKLFIDKRYNREGDLHVWKDDHIEWTKITELAKSLQCEIEKEEDFLLFSPKVKYNIYKHYKSYCCDTRYICLRKK